MDHLAASDGAHVGQHVEVNGEFVRTDPVVVTEYERWTGDRYRTGVLGFTVTDLETTVSPCRSIQVYGTLTSEGQIEAANGVVVPVGNVLYMYGISALASVWVLARLARGWTVDRETLAVEPRPDPLVTPGSTDPRDPERSTDA